MIALFDAGVRPNSPRMRHVRPGRPALGWPWGVVVALVAGLERSIGDPVTYLRGKWDQFTSLQSTTPTSTRLLTVGGQRYDLWRVATKEFESSPLLGVGASNYAAGYYRYRATDRNLNDPHSLVFAVLAENGAVGVGLLACCFWVGSPAHCGTGVAPAPDDAPRPGDPRWPLRRCPV